MRLQAGADEQAQRRFLAALQGVFDQVAKLIKAEFDGTFFKLCRLQVVIAQPVFGIDTERRQSVDELEQVVGRQVDVDLVHVHTPQVLSIIDMIVKK